jgi:Domain of unknown function (DUF4105)
MARRLLYLILCWLPVAAAASGDYRAELIAAARAKRLSEEPQWRALLHYHRRLIHPGFESQADDPSFFNAPDGKTNPEAELEATLAAFFSDDEETPKQQNPQCRFIARYHWLKRELAFDSARLPERPCRRFREWRAALNPQSLTLIFPAAYLNNPASLYGHTFLRVDAKDQDERTRLLAYSVNYAAATTETNGIAFAINGIFGGYPGVFSMAPYYSKVTEYNDIENRDIWEYELNFTPEEIDRLLMHVWELGPIRFDYYFFDENCSYHLLSLFDAARPTLHWTDRFPLWAIPADTVRVVTEEPGMLRRVTYRPSRSTLLRYQESRLTAEQVRLAKAIALGSAPVASAAAAERTDIERARVLELAYEYLDYERLRGRATDAPATAARLRELLLARSRVEVGADAPPPMPAVRPDQGHRSARAAIGVGRENGVGFQELRVRPAYHDLLDPEDGYIRGAAIEFFNFALRHRERDDRTRLEQLDFVDIVSLAPRDELLKPWSWRINVGYARARLDSANEPLVFHVAGGAGGAWEPAPSLLTYAMLEGALATNHHLEAGFAVGAGPAFGALFDVTQRWRLQLEARALRYGIGDVHSTGELIADQRFTLGRQAALRLEWSHHREFDQTRRTGALFLDYYF